MNTVHITFKDNHVETYHDVTNVHVRLEWKMLYIYQGQENTPLDLDNIDSIIVREE